MINNDIKSCYVPRLQRKESLFSRKRSAAHYLTAGAHHSMHSCLKLIAVFDALQSCITVITALNDIYAITRSTPATHLPACDVKMRMHCRAKSTVLHHSQRQNVYTTKFAPRCNSPITLIILLFKYKPAYRCNLLSHRSAASIGICLHLDFASARPCICKERPPVGLPTGNSQCDLFLCLPPRASRIRLKLCVWLIENAG
jgi:hypothetical protein